jgi:hypothetical protein
MMQFLTALPVGVWHPERSKDSGRAFSNVQKEHRAARQPFGRLRLSGSLSAPKLRGDVNCRCASHRLAEKRRTLTGRVDVQKDALNRFMAV